MASADAPDRPVLALLSRWRLPLAYAAVVLATYLLALLVGTLRRGHPSVAADVVAPFLFPVLFFLLPPIVAAWHTAVGGRPRDALAVGLAPALVFPVMVGIGRLAGVGAIGDAPLGPLVLLYALIGVLGAGTGVVVVWGFQRLVDG